MFWLGLLIALITGLVRIGLSREWAKRRFPWIRDLQLDVVAMVLLVLGLFLSVLGYREQTATIKRLEAERIGRVLSGAQKAALIEDLGRLPKINVHLMGIQGDRESVRFANVLKDVFLSVGWTVDGVWEDILIGGAGTGILVRQSSPFTNSVGQQVIEAFNRIQLQARLVQIKDRGPGHFEVIVGSRP